MVGGSYTAGCGLCVALQHLIARSILPIGSPWRLTRAAVIAYLSHGGIYCLGEFPNQLYGRALIMIVGAALGQQTAGVYVYIRQVLIGFAQIIGFVKRVEFPRLASVLVEKVRFRKLVMAQLVSLAASVLVFIAAFVTFHFRDYLPVRFSEIAFYFVFFAAVVPVWALSTSFGQALIIQHKMIAYSSVLLSTIALSAIIMIEFTPTFGLTFVAWCDIMTYVVQTVLFAIIVYRN
jgi:O-antigen/teichoic acid export membrane protein